MQLDASLLRPSGGQPDQAVPKRATSAPKECDRDTPNVSQSQHRAYKRGPPTGAKVAHLWALCILVVSVVQGVCDICLIEIPMRGLPSHKIEPNPVCLASQHTCLAETYGKRNRRFRSRSSRPSATAGPPRRPAAATSGAPPRKSARARLEKVHPAPPAGGVTPPLQREGSVPLH